MTEWSWVVTVCGGVATIGGAVAVLRKMFAPLTNLSKRVEVVEAHDQRDMERFEDINMRMVLQKKESQAMMKALYAIMGHSIDGNSTDDLKKARASLIEHIIDN